MCEPEKMLELQRRLTKELSIRMVEEVTSCGGSVSHVLLLAETLCVSVLLYAREMGYGPETLDLMASSVRKRLQRIDLLEQFPTMPIKGHA